MFEAKDSYELRIIPFKSVNELSFGIQRQEVWNKLGNPKTSFMKASFSKTETDDYEKFHIYYDTNYNFEAIEIFGDIDVYYNDEKLSKMYSETLKYFKNIFDDIEEDDNGFISRKGSIGVYIENDEDIVNSILFARKDYYN